MRVRAWLCAAVLGLLPFPGLASTLTGYVLDAREQPVSGLRLTIIHVRTQESVTITTDSRGLFMQVLEQGDYDIVMSASGLEVSLGQVELIAGENRMMIIRVPGGILVPTVPESNVSSPERSLAAIREYRVMAIAREGSAPPVSDAMAPIVNPFPAQKRGKVYGSVYEFHRNDNLDARNFFDPPGEGRPEYKRNEFGLVLGTSLSERLKLLGTYEGLRIIQGSTLISHVPTPEMKRGDFSSFALQLRDPLNGEPLAENRIPESRLHPVALGLLHVLPDPNAADPDRNYINSQPFVLDRDSMSFRVDYQLQEGSNLFGRYSLLDSHRFGVHPLPSFGSQHAERDQDLSLSVSERLTSRLLGSVSFGFGRYRDLLASPNSGQEGLLESLGISGVSVDDPEQEGYPDFRVSGYASFGDAGLPITSTNNRFSTEGGLTWTPEDHTFRVGAGWTAYQANNASSEGVRRGRFTFSGYYSGDAFADFLFGMPDAATRGIGSDRQDMRRKSWYAYVRDEWRASPSFSLSGGLLYNYWGPFRSVSPNVSGFIPLLFEPPRDGEIVTAGSKRAEELGLGPAGQGSLVFPDRNDLAPSFGIAYRPLGNNRLVLRSSYSLRYNPLGRDYYVAYMGRNYPFYYTETALSPVDQPLLDLADPFAEASTTGLGVRGIETTIRSGYIQDWVLNLQSQLHQQWYFESGYEGNRATGMARLLPSNIPLPDAEPIQSRRPNPDFGRFTILTGGGAYTRHGMDTAVERRLADGFAFKAGFSWTVLISDLYGGNPNNVRNLAAERAGSDYLPARRLYLNYLFELPFGRTGTVGRGVGSFVNGLIGGWRLSGITNIQDGTRFSVYLPGDQNNDGVADDRPDRFGSGVLEESKRSVDQWFETAHFSAPAPYTYGNAGRNILTGPPYADWDVSVIKQVRLSDGDLVELRVEFFNAFNNVNFELPYRVLGTSSFGKIFGARRSREIEVALRYSF